MTEKATRPKRRANGEGSITLRADGLWHARAWLEAADGTLKRVHAYGRSRAEAWQKMENKKAEGARGFRPSARRGSVAVYLRDWLEHVHRPSVGSPLTAERTSNLLEWHVLEYVEGVRLDGFRAREVDRLLATIQREGGSADTAHKVRALLHKAFADAVKRGDVAVNPVSAAVRPKVVRKKVTPYTGAEVGKLLEAEATPRLRALAATALLGGLRYGELAALRWRDVDLEVGSVNVSRNLRLTREGFEEGDPKTRAGRRTVWLPGRALDALKAYRAALPALPHGTVRVFASPDGRELRHQNFVRREWRPLCERAKVPVRTFHSTRHTATTLLVEAGVDAETVRDTLGHADVSTTLRHYGHTSEERKRKAALAVGSLLATPTTPAATPTGADVGGQQRS